MTRENVAQFAVAPEYLRRHVDPSQLPMTSADVPPLEDTIGQPRALDALAFGLSINSSGYLAGKFCQQYPLSLAATITFEQSYDEVEGIPPRRPNCTRYSRRSLVCRCTRASRSPARSISTARFRLLAGSRPRSKVSSPSARPGG